MAAIDAAAEREIPPLSFTLAPLSASSEGIGAPKGVAQLNLSSLDMATFLDLPVVVHDVLLRRPDGDEEGKKGESSSSIYFFLSFFTS